MLEMQLFVKKINPIKIHSIKTEMINGLISKLFDTKTVLRLKVIRKFKVSKQNCQIFPVSNFLIVSIYCFPLSYLTVNTVVLDLGLLVWDTSYLTTLLYL